MAEFSLPSGLVVETREPLWGDELHALSIGLNDPEEFAFAKFAAVVPSLTREEIKRLTSVDGRALMREVNRIFLGRTEEEKIPFGNGSTTDSEAMKSPTPTSGTA